MIEVNNRKKRNRSSQESKPKLEPITKKMSKDGRLIGQKKYKAQKKKEKKRARLLDSHGNNLEGIP